MASIPPTGPDDLSWLSRTLMSYGLLLGPAQAERQFATIHEVVTGHQLDIRLYVWPLQRAADGQGRISLVGVEPKRTRRGWGRSRALVLAFDRRREVCVLWLPEDGGPPAPFELAVDEVELERGAQTGLEASASGGRPRVVLQPAPLARVLRNIDAEIPWSDGVVEVARDPAAYRREWRKWAEDVTGQFESRMADRIAEPGSVPYPRIPEPEGKAFSLFKSEIPDPPAVVETGFASVDRPDETLPAGQPLQPATDHLFWFGVGSGRSGAIDSDPQTVPGSAPGLRLTVQLFAFDDELALIGATQGQIELDAGERSRVVSAAAAVDEIGDPSTVGRLLYFTVRSPDAAGTARMRCNVYAGSTLIQSHLVTAQVGGAPPPEGPALRVDVDYRLSDELRADDLRQLPPHDMSVLINGTGTSHQFRVFADLGDEELFANDASLDAVGLQAAVDDARGALRRVAWGTDVEWNKEPSSYRYDQAPSFEAFTADLVLLAIRGRRLYLPIARQLAGNAAARRRLEELLSGVCRIQIASAASGMYVPAAMFYDHPLEDLEAFGGEGYRLCQRFRDALESQAPLEQLECFRSGCPERNDLHSVCASGFWGLRHDIGWPLSTERPLTELVAGDGTQMLIGVSTDQGLTQRDEHVQRLGEMTACTVVESRDAFAETLRQPPPTLIYLYCHGGVEAPNTPYVEIGSPGSEGITEAFFSNHGILFEDPARPLVFVNGCHTTALEPAQVMSLVNGFVQEANAVGVIGTELTVFEPLAVAFAEALLAAFVDGSTTIGTAVRHARLQLLQQRNPLGLVYVPFVAAATRIVVGDVTPAAGTPAPA